MKNSRSIIAITVALLLPSFSYALSPESEQQLNTLAQASTGSIKDVAQTIQASGEAELEVTDALAELLLTHQEKNDAGYVDALAWTCKALEAVNNPRYAEAVQAVMDGGAHKKLKKHCKGANKTLNKSLKKEADAEQYTKGSFDLAARREALLASLPETTADGKKSIGAVEIGMLMEDVYDLCGNPDATTSHITGKQFRPFNFKGGDSVRMYALYKGQGRITFTQSSHYDTRWKVLEVLIDPSETGQE